MIQRAHEFAIQAYYLPNKDRSNLSVLLLAHVNRLLTEKAEDGTLAVTGVEFTHDGKTHTVAAKNEVVLCAGCSVYSLG